MLEYVLALLFTADAREVVLVRKTRPAWQAGRVNALGGKLQTGEDILAAARREVREEAGVDVEVAFHQGLLHGFANMTGTSRTSAAAMRAAAEMLKTL